MHASPRAPQFRIANSDVDAFAGYTIAQTSSIIFSVKRASSERMSFEWMMLPKLIRGSDGAVRCLHHCGECVVFYFIAVSRMSRHFY
jgi:hypothetical protein